MKVYYVYTEEYLSRVKCMHQRAWMADWCAWKLAWNYFESARRYNPEGWRLMWVKDPWAGYPGWGWGPDSTEAYSYVVPMKVEVP